MGNLKGSVSFVVPCLNEQETLPDVLTKIRKVCLAEFEARQTEVIVCDNGSTDNSVKIAQEHGAKVVHCAEKINHRFHRLTQIFFATKAQRNLPRMNTNKHEEINH
jgi:glycosyltransferase involved in cell wall biosynthesis